MKQNQLNSMTVDDLFALHERIAATLDVKIAAEKKRLQDQLKRAEMSLH